MYEEWTSEDGQTGSNDNGFLHTAMHAVRKHSRLAFAFVGICIVLVFLSALHEAAPARTLEANRVLREDVQRPATAQTADRLVTRLESAVLEALNVFNESSVQNAPPNTTAPTTTMVQPSHAGDAESATLAAAAEVIVDAEDGATLLAAERARADHAIAVAAAATAALEEARARLSEISRDLGSLREAVREAPRQALREKAAMEQQALRDHAAASAFRSMRGRVADDLLPRRAFVTLAHEPVRGSFRYTWQALALARALQKVSAYPLVLLTDAEYMPDGRTRIAEGLRPLNIHVLPLAALNVPASVDVAQNPTWKYAYWKLQIWNLTQFEKLVWVDSDSLITRSLDWLFEEDWMWAQRDDWFCRGSQSHVCSGLVLAFPSAADFQGLQQHAATGPYWEKADQGIIESYFLNVRHRPVRLLLDSDAGFGRCLGRVPSVYLDRQHGAIPGIWDVPAFVHKSSGYGGTNNAYNNVCFSPFLELQYYSRQGLLFNACHLHPLGPMWRELFCEAVAFAGATSPEIATFCDDGCWYRGERSLPAPIGDDGRSCRRVQSFTGAHPGVPLDPWIGGTVL